MTGIHNGSWSALSGVMEYPSAVNVIKGDIHLNWTLNCLSKSYAFMIFRTSLLAGAVPYTVKGALDCKYAKPVLRISKS
jgi:hypothetical protein